MTLDEPISEELILDVVSKIFKGSTYKPKFLVERGSKVGEGFLGVTCSVQVKIGEEVKYLFVKMVPQNEKLRKTISLTQVFDREASFYLELWPILNKIYIKYLKRDFDITPTCLFVKKDYLKEAMAFDNISICGYSIKGGKESLDRNHLLLSLKTYSYFHACGFIFKNDYPDKFQEMTKSKPDIYFKAVCSLFEFNKIVCFGIDILRDHCSHIDDKAILNSLNKIKTEIVKAEDYINEIKEHCTIIHADCWRNNLMFKYKKDSNDLEDLKLVDMQMWTINSPVFDVLHVIYSNVSGDESLDDLDYYFDYYYESLCEAISEMNGNPEVSYPRSVYLSHLKKYCYYGPFIASIVIRVVLADLKDIPNIAEMVLQDKPLGQAFIFNLPNEELFCKKLKVILRHCLNNNVF